MRRPLLSLLVPTALLALCATDAAAQRTGGAAPGDDVGLPRVREGGSPPDDLGRPLVPYALPIGSLEMPPTTGFVASPPEYSPCDGVLYRYGAGWNSVVTECVVKLTADPAHDEKAYVVVTSASQQTSATTAFANAGADLSKVVFFVMPSDSIWIRDFGPHFVWQSDTLAIADSHYYPTRPLDNFVPTRLAEDEFVVPPYPMGLYYSGGNFQPGPGRTAFVSSLVQQDNPEFTAAEIGALYAQYQGIDTLHILPRLPGSVDGTGHIDMWMYLVDEDTVIISEFLPGSNATAIQITNDAVPYMEALGFEVFRTPAWNVGSTHYTYTNAYRVNDRIFVPTYVSGNPAYADDDATALAAWQAAAGAGVEIVPIDCYSIIPAAGAIHCIVMQVPRYTEPVPAVQLLSPVGGELLVPGTTVDVAWSATDDVEVAGVDLSYSTDGGATFPHVIATDLRDGGHFDWTVPDDTTAFLAVKARVYDDALNAVEDESPSTALLMGTQQHVYDFATGAGVDRWAWGWQTSSWTQLEGVRHPAAASTQLTAAQYAALAASDATGGDTDTNRYISVVPSSGNETTHVFEFTIAEDPSTLVDLGIAWEGYGDQCIQMELYVWDEVAGNWCDTFGGQGQNRYARNFAGNRDWTLDLHVRHDFERYIDAQGKLTFLLYGERSAQESFHDHVQVTTSWIDCQRDLGYGGPGLVDLSLCGGNLMQAGVNGAFLLEGAAPGAPALLFLGDVVNPTPLKGGVLVPFPFVYVATGLFTDGLGRIAFPVPGSDGIPARVILQMVVGTGGTGFEFSNALEVFMGT